MSPFSTHKTVSSVVPGVAAAGPGKPLPARRPEALATDDDSPRKIVVRTILPLYADVLSERFVLDVVSARRAGRSWAESGRSLEWLLDAVQHLTADLVDKALNRPDLQDPASQCEAVQRIGELGRRILVELTHGFGLAREESAKQEELTPRRRAQLLLSGGTTPPSDVIYAVVAVHAPGAEPAGVEEAFRIHGGAQTLTLLGQGGGHALLPAHRRDEAAKTCEQVLAALGPAARAALVWPPQRGLSAAKAVADNVLAEAIALDFAPAVHVLDDVLLEFAAAHEPMVSNAMLKVIQPLLAHPVLWDTLQVLLAVDGNRGKAADRLIVHRSTIDYRLQRIGQLTGHNPCTVQGLRLLATASAMHRMAELRQRTMAA